MTGGKQMTDIIIVGAGPAGLTAAIYGLRAGKKVLLFEANSYGGRIINTPDIANYPGIAHISGFEFAMNLYNQASALGAEVIFERVARVEDAGDRKIVHTEAGKTYEAKAVILATGSKNKPLGLDREQELLGKGVSYCATCDGAFFREKDVVIQGGGKMSFEDAIFLAGYCRKVYFVQRQGELKGNQPEIDALKEKKNVEFILNARVTKLIGENNLEAVEITERVPVKTSDGSENNPVKWENRTRVIDVSGLFVAVGEMPDNLAFVDVVELDKNGYIQAAEDCTTKVPGIFVAGDCRTKKVRQLTTAAADGTVAALAAAAVR